MFCRVAYGGATRTATMCTTDGPVNQSFSFLYLVARIVIDPGRHLTADVGVEAVAGQQSISALAPPARIGRGPQGAQVAREQAFRCDPVRGRHDPVLSVAARLRLPPFGEDKVDRCPVHTLEPELGANGALAARSGSIPRLDPGAGEGFVIEHPEVEHPFDRAVDEIRAIARAGQAPADLMDRARSNLEKSRGGLEHDGRIVDRGPPFACLRRRAAAAGPEVTRPRRCPRPGS